MEIARALRLKGETALPSPPPCLAVVGAGGKSTTLFRLARELLGSPHPTVLITTTTHLAQHQAEWADWHLVLQTQGPAALLRSAIPPGAGLVTCSPTEDGKLASLPEPWLEEACRLAKEYQLPLLIEADGARQRPLKAPADHEPAIPDFADMVLVLAGLSALGKPLEAQWVHRPEIFASLAGQRIGEAVTWEGIARVLNHPEGGLKNIPTKARRVLLLNQVSNPETQEAARHIALACLGRYHAIIEADLSSSQPVQKVHEPVAAVILAAGEASRFGQPKQLLNWEGQPLVCRAASTALQAGCSPVLVVVGAYAEQVRHALQRLPVQIVENPNWKQGVSSSVKTAIAALPETSGGALFLLADQPQVSASLIEKIISLHCTALAPLTAPRCRGQRANPVLFDRSVFPKLLALQGDVGGRALFSDQRLSIAWLEWEDPTLLLDIDTPEDLKQFQERSL